MKITAKIRLRRYVLTVPLYQPCVRLGLDSRLNLSSRQNSSLELSLVFLCNSYESSLSGYDVIKPISEVSATKYQPLKQPNNRIYEQNIH